MFLSIRAKVHRGPHGTRGASYNEDVSVLPPRSSGSRSPEGRTWRGTTVAVGLLAIFAAATALAFAHLVIRIDLRREVVARPTGDFLARVGIDGGATVGFVGPLESQIVVRDPISISLDRPLSVPIDMELDVPIDTQVFVDQVVDVALEAPVDVVLTEHELRLERLSVPIDTSVLIDDRIAINTVVPIDSAVSSVLGLSVPVKANLPIQMSVPIKQRVHVRDTIDLAVTALRAPLHMTIPIAAKVPIKQAMHVTGRILVPVHDTIRIALGGLSIRASPEPVRVTVNVPEPVSVHLAATLAPSVALPDPVQVQLGALRVDSRDVTLHLK